MFDALGLGELLIDFTALGGHDYRANPGGAVANVMAMMAKLGKKTAFIGKIGRDRFGDLLAEALDQAGVDTSGLVWSDKFPTTLAFVHAQDGDHTFSFYRRWNADVMLKPEQVDDAKILHTKLFHFGGVSLSEEPVRSTTLMALDYAKARDKLVSFDPNYREALWPSPENAIREMLAVLPQVDILKVSLDELTLLTGEHDLKIAAAKLIELGPQLVLVSLGEAGACFFTEKLEGQVCAPQVEVVDTTGAGDAFLGAFLSYFLELEKPLDMLDKEELTGLLEYANQAGALTCTAQGAMSALPTREEIENW